MIFRTSPQADEDIADAYVAGAVRFDVNQADRYQDGLFAAFQMLADNPLMARERRELVLPVRLYPYQAHMIVYIKDGPGVLIVRVLHDRMDWERTLS